MTQTAGHLSPSAPQSLSSSARRILGNSDEILERGTSGAENRSTSRAKGLGSSQVLNPAPRVAEGARGKRSARNARVVKGAGSSGGWGLKVLGVLGLLGVPGVPGVAGLGCQTETRCCSLPPCLCGQYVSCIEESCLTATCEICPEGLFCDCSAACAPIGSSGWDYIQVCPRGHYCPYYSGAPTPCPAGTHLDKTGGIRLEECTECGFMLSSGEGAATCSLGTVSILIIVAAVSGCCLCSLGSVWLYRRRQAKRLQELAEFEFEMRHNGMKLARDMEMSEYGNGNGHHQNGNGFSSSRALVSSEEDDYSMSAESDFYQPSEFSSEANGGQAKRMTAAEKQAALAQRMQALEEQQETLFDAMESKMRAEHEVEEGKKKRRTKPLESRPTLTKGFRGRQKVPDEEEDIEICV